MSKQKELANKYHTCKCNDRLMAIDWESTALVEVDFEKANNIKPSGRLIWFVSSCRTCDGRILHGCSFCDYRVVGEELINKALKEAKRKVNNSYGLMDTLKKLWQKKNLEVLWEKLGDVPVNDDGKIEESFLDFEVGTDREDIWHWFEEQNPDISVAKLMYSGKGQ